ncbi:ribonuclease J [Geosporobacter ferrireducens]|uniref:Ribonuclease J n=1 Tax=Geosporobacter ferrireducens TaxID=1424294 RepID=A0A1D8GEN1_9FIRM|nr:ribonuclease J [Geosporobacter ferrireducens]AOT69364.1 ribonuclease J [Geosporobacter ferrireducens]MTI57052.1 ribonuclease J [Geosporobacter ferrireducens]
MSKSKKKLRVIPLGGLGEIGKNITVFEYDEDIIIVDCGVAFPEDEMMGIDLVLPDLTYLRNKKDKIRGIVLTHGHEDHIGALPYVLRDFNVPVYGTKLTLGLLKTKLEEHRMLSDTTLEVVQLGQTIELGVFQVEFIHSCHSIADAAALAIHTPVGIVLHTSDFKVDYTPIEGASINLARFAELGKKGVLLLMCDSTNAEREGYTLSERIVGETFEKIFVNIQGRIIVATFASNIHRVQQIINVAVNFNRKIAISGRSMVNVVNVALELGYLSAPEGTFIDINDINSYPFEKLMIITTGSQGEPMAALSRMASATHRQVEIVPGDLVVISATPIPGNEKMVSKTINNLFQKGAKVIYESLADIHVSGHACQEELKLIHSLVKPRFFMPVHGEYKHLIHHGLLAEQLGMPTKDIFIMDTGNILELDSSQAKLAGNAPSGKVFVDGLGVGDVGNIVLRDRKLLSQDGMVIIIITIDKETGTALTNPDIISRGFIYVRESEELIAEIRAITKSGLAECQGKDWSTIKNHVKKSLGDYLYTKTKRKPMILPIIMEV